MQTVPEYFFQVGLIAILGIVCFALYRSLPRVTGYFARGVLGLAFIAVLCATNYFAFRYVADTNYFLWFLEKGPLITLSFAVIAVIWDDLNMNTALLESYPPRFIVGCLWLAGAFFQLVEIFSGAVGQLMQKMADYSRQARLSAKTGDTAWNETGRLLVVLFWMLGTLFETIVSLGITLLILSAAVMWCITVAPLLYFVHLVSAAPARMAVFAEIGRVMVRREKDRLKFSVIAHSAPLPAGAGEISFTKKPFALTSALSAALLSLLKYGWDCLSAAG